MSDEQITPIEAPAQEYNPPAPDAGSPPDQGKTEAEVAADKAAKDEKPRDTREVVAEAMEKAKVKHDEREKAKAEAKAEPAKEAKPEPKAEKPEVKPEAKADEKPDAKADDKPQAQRSPDGKFAKAEDEKPVSDAPARFSEAARKEWANAPQSVRDEVTRAISENEAGIAKYRQSAEEYEGIREYADMARQHGTDLRSALGNYVGIENMLRQNPLQGLEQIVSNLGLKDNQGNPITFRAIAAHVAGMSPDQVQADHDRTVTGLRQQVQQLTQHLSQVTQYVQQQQYDAKATAMQAEWEKFATANPRASELAPEMVKVLQEYPANGNIPASDRMRDAYAIAAARHPMTAQTGSGNPDAAQTGQGQRETVRREPNPEGQKSVFGSPSSAAELPKAKNAEPLSSRDAVAYAMRRAQNL